MTRASHPEPRLLTEDVLVALSDIAQVNVAEQGSFTKELRSYFRMAPDWHRFDLAEPKRLRVRKQLVGVEKAAARLKGRLDELDVNARKALGLSLLRCLEFRPARSLAEHNHQMLDLKEVGDGVARGGLLLKSYARGVEMIHAGASSYEFPVSPKRGAKSKSPSVAGNPRTTAADLFVLEIYGCVNRHGGRLTLDKNLGGGTARKFFDTAADYLPLKFGLRGFSSSRLQELRKFATGEKIKQK